MILVFQRTGKRRYSIVAKRHPFPDLEMNPAPGYDPLMPHDMMHLVVEAELGLTRGVFGQLAAGGDTATFHPIFDPHQNARAAARVKRDVRARGKTLLRDGREESAQSERATYICWQEWRARSQAPEQRTASRAMGKQAKHLRAIGPAKETHSLNEKKLDQICQHLDDLSAHWSRLEVGESMSIHWPGLSVSESPALMAEEA